MYFIMHLQRKPSKYIPNFKKQNNNNQTNKTNKWTTFTFNIYIRTQTWGLFYFARLISNGCVLTPRCRVISGFPSSLPKVGIWLSLVNAGCAGVRSCLDTHEESTISAQIPDSPGRKSQSRLTLPALFFSLQVFQEPKNDSECVSNIKEFLKGCTAFRVEVSRVLGTQ